MLRTNLVRVSTATVTAALLLSGCSRDDEPTQSGAAARSQAASSQARTDAAAILTKAGLEQIQGGDDVAASGTFRSVLALDPSNVYAHYNLGLIAQRAGQDKQALASYDAALEVDPRFPSALFNRGILTERMDLHKAVALYRRAIESDPQFAAAFMRLGFALVHLGQPAEASEMLGRGIALDPGMKDVEAPSYPVRSQ